MVPLVCIFHMEIWRQCTIPSQGWINYRADLDVVHVKFPRNSKVGENFTKSMMRFHCTSLSIIRYYRNKHININLGLDCCREFINTFCITRLQKSNSTVRFVDARVSAVLTNVYSGHDRRLGESDVITYNGLSGPGQMPPSLSFLPLAKNSLAQGDRKGCHRLRRRIK